jgi:hypothetical protein
VTLQLSTSTMQDQHDDDGHIYDEVNTKKESFDVIENSCYVVTSSRVGGAEDYIWEESQGYFIHCCDSTIDMHCWCMHSFHTKDD